MILFACPLMFLLLPLPFLPKYTPTNTIAAR